MIINNFIQCMGILATFMATKTLGIKLLVANFTIAIKQCAAWKVELFVNKCLREVSTIKKYQKIQDLGFFL